MGVSGGCCPTGTDLEVTPFVASQDFYTTTVTEQRYAPSITVNSVSLGVGTPEFCVGQYLEFQLAFDPPPESVSQMSLWYLPGAPVNESWQPSPSGSLNYRFNQNLLTNLTTQLLVHERSGRHGPGWHQLGVQQRPVLLLRGSGQFQPRPAGVLWF